MKRVVVIDDEKYVRQGIVGSTNWAEVDCLVVGEAANGQEGYDLVLEKRPDLVICDVRMPLMDGLSMVEALRREGIQTKVIFLTAYSDFSYIQKALRLGAVDYILKPFGDGELEAAIRRIFEREERVNGQEGDGHHGRDEAMLQSAGGGDGRQTDTNLRKEERSGPDPFRHQASDAQLLPIKGEDQVMNRYVRSAIRYITEHYQEEGVSISTVAAALDVSEGHLSRLFKKDTGMSISTYVTTYRIRQAMRLLHDIQYRVSEVAAQVGYTDVAYFSSTFRKLTGMTPTEFQKR